MKILKITVSGYKMLAPGFTINFLTKTRIDPEQNNEDLFALKSGFYLPKEYAFIGRNSSGKSTVLSLVKLCFSILQSGRAYLEKGVKEGAHLDLTVLFYDEGLLKRYEVHYHAPAVRGETISYYKIDDEDYQVGELRPFYKKDLSDAAFHKERAFKKRSGGLEDTSSLPSFVKDPFPGMIDAGAYYTHFTDLLEWIYRSSHPAALQKKLERVSEKIFNLLDEGIVSLKPGQGDHTFIYTRKNQTPLCLGLAELDALLSEGTKTGYALYASAVLSFFFGWTMLVDEIERNFNKNLVENIIIMFNDKRLNPKGATLVFSTHYSEILDLFARNDNIDVLHKENDVITLANVSEDYEQRVELSKSKAFNNNTFDTLLNYDKLMDLKTEIWSD